MGLFADSFSQFRNNLFMGNQGQNQNFLQRYNTALPPSAYAWQRDYAESPEGAPGLFEMFRGSYDQTNPGLARILQRGQGRVNNQYQAATFADPTLSYSQFLGAYSPERLRKSYNPFERGERPYAYQRGYKYLGG